MKRNPATIYEIYRYQNRTEYDLVKHTGTILLQKFNHLDIDFEIRLNKTRTRGFVCIDGISFESFTSIERVERELKANELWYLALNWSDAPDYIANELPERRKYLETTNK